MHEITKAFCGLLLLAGSLVSVVAWIADHPDDLIWGVRIGAGLVTFVSLVLILHHNFRRDLEQDYLNHIGRHYFNRDGFCFLFSWHVDESSAYCIDLYFQSQHATGSHALVALRPASNFWMSRPEIAPLKFEIECPPAGFGAAHVQIAMPKKLQGKSLRFEVGATVHYPAGKGQRVRFGSGIDLQPDANFRQSTKFMLIRASSLLIAPIFKFSRDPTIELPVPLGVVDLLPEPVTSRVEISWELGDPELTRT